MSSQVPSDDIDAWSRDWAYETDLVLVHLSGLKVRFDDLGDETRGDDQATDATTLRGRSLGDFVDGTVKLSRTTLMNGGASEVDASKATLRLLGQAQRLFRERPPGTPDPSTHRELPSHSLD